MLNLSVIDRDGVVWHLVHDIPESDFNVEEGGQVEIIGWLYQYYNTEPKNKAFAKKGKITKDEVPAVTQLFTPDWIVRYMVENSLGRLWVEGHPNEELKSNWKYYLEEAGQEPEVVAQLEEIRKEYAKLNPEDIRLIDPCMGSGHILVYAFDVLMQIYESAGYGQRDAARSILENNIYGLDIDDRAFQMAYFAIMMKARQYNRRILSGDYKPNLYAIKESNGIDRNQLKNFGKGLNEIEKNIAINQITGLLDTFKDAKEYGSILIVGQYDWDILNRFVSNVEVIGQFSFDSVGIDETKDRLKQIINQGRCLATSYHIAVTNPPYMGVSNASSKLSEYIKRKYPRNKIDLFSVFMEQLLRLCVRNGYCALITQQTWMFISSFKKTREMLDPYKMTSMVHLGTRAFEDISGEVVQSVSYITQKVSANNYKTAFIKLDDLDDKECHYRDKNRRFNKDVHQFRNLPDYIYAYWLSNQVIDSFNIYSPVANYADGKIGLQTGDNAIFLRLWQEVDITKVTMNGISSERYWVPYNKAGGFRRWYGNNDYVLNWHSDGDAVINCRDENGRLKSRPQNRDYYFRKGITWSDVCTGLFSMRRMPAFFVFDSCAPSIFSDEKTELYLLGLYNTKVAQKYLSFLAPTIHYTCGSVLKLPCIISSDVDFKLIKESVELAKEDWDSFENSWDFECHPLVKRVLRPSHCNEGEITIEKCFRVWSDECDRRFNQLKENEEELNRIFINIYGLQEELSPGVEDKDVTVRRANLQRDIKSLLSYAVGCMFGRYSLSSMGLAYAGGKWNERKYDQFKPDVDNIIPISDEEYLEDDIVSRLGTFLKVAFGEDTLEENLDFIAKVLASKGSSSREIIRNYFLNDFFKDHCQIYSVSGSGKRPIYWLFDSGKQNGFKALIYLHRYNADTIGNLRIDYLHRMQRIYESEINRMQDMIDHSASAREAAQATKRREKLTKQLKECREYDEKLAHLALSRIELDLDDGVKVNYRKLQTASDGKFYEVLADSKSIMSKK